MDVDRQRLLKQRRQKTWDDGVAPSVKEEYTENNTGNLENKLTVLGGGLNMQFDFDIPLVTLGSATPKLSHLIMQFFVISG